MKDLPPTAQRLLEAARHLLETSGYDALSYEAIGEAAGVNKSLIRYHFGGKPGLMIALTDWLVDDLTSDMRRRFAQLPEGEGRLRVLLDDHIKMVRDYSAYRSYFELVPHILEDPQMRAQWAGALAAYRQMNLAGLVNSDEGARNPEAVTLAALTMAVADGMAIQLLMDPGCIDLDLAFALWERFVRLILSRP